MRAETHSETLPPIRRGELKVNDNPCSDVSNVKPLNLEHIPLAQRLKILYSHSVDSHSSTLQNDSRIPLTRKRTLDAVVKNEPEDCDSQVSTGRRQVTSPPFQIDASGAEKVSANVSILARCPTLAVNDVRAAVKVEDSEIVSSSVDKGTNTSLQIDSPTPNVKKEVPEGVVDDLDHIVLKERLRILLARKLPGLSNTVFEDSNAGISEIIMKQIDEKVNDEIYSADGKTEARDQCCDTPEGSNTSPFESPLGATSGSSLLTDCTSSKSTVSVISTGLQEDDYILKSGRIITQFNSHVEQNAMPINNDVPSSSTSPTFVKVKDEPWDYCENHNVKKDAMGSLSIKLPNVKSEWEVHNGYQYHDVPVEHMRLIDRLNILMAREDSSLNISTSYSSLKKTKPSSFMSSSIYSKFAEPLSIKCRRKRKKTATDSVQTALEEDAPGLLQVLLDKGVLVDEIKLYGEDEDDEAVDESEDNFSELEDVITKIFSQRHSFFKFPIPRASKTSRGNYCLACLISLVEQTRYLKFRKWPVEWGWCRDLQSFIFVFPKHNRLVLERPEYGYATYFFELVERLPVEWQIKRLVICMKLTTCSRISLIENKELVVGEDLTQGEAKVLMEYGWTPNSALGTLLNYRDRVVHDRKNDKDSSEWRSKIGKLLMDGYNGGTIVTSNIPKKFEEFMCAQSPDISCSSSMSD